MSKIYWKATIEDIHNTNCSEIETELLIDLFIHTYKHMATTSARKAYYELKDFALYSRREYLEDFILWIERTTVEGVDQWIGNFENGDKKLYILGMLER